MAPINAPSSTEKKPDRLNTPAVMLPPNSSMTKATPRLAPALMPRMDGPASGFLESRLQHQSADSQCATAKQRRQRLGQTGFPKDEAPACLLPLSTEQDTENIGRRNRNRPHQQIARKKQ